MRWTKKSAPKVGDKKTVIRFAWWPADVGNLTIWLERYAVVYEYTLWLNGGCWEEKEIRTQADWKF